MLCEHISPDIEDIEGDKIICNHLLNPKLLTTNLDNFLVCQQHAQDQAIQLKIEEIKI